MSSLPSITGAWHAMLLLLVPMLLAVASTGACIWMYLATKSILHRDSPPGASPAPPRVLPAARRASPDLAPIAAELRDLLAILESEPAARSTRPRQIPASAPIARIQIPLRATGRSRASEQAPPSPMNAPELELYRKFRRTPAGPDTTGTGLPAAAPAPDLE